MTLKRECAGITLHNMALREQEKHSREGHMKNPEVNMNRREFIIKSGLLALGTSFTTGCLLARERSRAKNSSLGEHRIDKVEYVSAKYHYPRLVGRNSKRPKKKGKYKDGIHGQHHSDSCVKLYTDQGAMGWGRAKKRLKDRQLQETVLGKRVSELINPEVGISDDVDRSLDIALHDVAGVILNKPVYEMLGAHGPKATDVYSGMIYFDELDANAKVTSLDKVMKNCQWDYEYGYRKFKVKIGRGGHWYPHDEGLATDIKIVKMIHDEYGDKGVEILVDANDGYSLQDTIDFLKGVKDVPIYWVEEPFPEDLEKSRALKKWMMANGREKTYYSDGESKVKYDLVKKLIIEGTLDMHLVDIVSYGFTRWRKLMPFLVKHNAVASPHTWGSMLKTHYVSHLAAGIGNVVTIEGVTCISDEIDFGDYKIADGKLHVSSKPGFGMKLLI